MFSHSLTHTKLFGAKVDQRVGLGFDEESEAGVRTPLTHKGQPAVPTVFNTGEAPF